VGGKYDKFVGLLQEKYGYTREHAEEEINRPGKGPEKRPLKNSLRPMKAVCWLVPRRFSIPGEAAR